VTRERWEEKRGEANYRRISSYFSSNGHCLLSRRWGTGLRREKNKGKFMFIGGEMQKESNYRRDVRGHGGVSAFMGQNVLTNFGGCLLPQQSQDS